MLVQDQMTPNPVCGRQEMTVEQIRQTMQERGFRHMPIVDENKKLVGLVTQGTLAGTIQADHQHMSAHEARYILNRLKANDIMVKDVLTTTENTPIEEAARVMADHKISCLPVVRDGEPVGIITDNDLFTTMASLLGARRSGIRVTVLHPDRVGEVARISKAIADKGGYLSVFVTYPTSDPSIWAAVLKVVNIPQNVLVQLLSGLPDIRVKDVQEQ